MKMEANMKVHLKLKEEGKKDIIKKVMIKNKLNIKAISKIQIKIIKRIQLLSFNLY